MEEHSYLLPNLSVVELRESSKAVDMDSAREIQIARLRDSIPKSLEPRNMCSKRTVLL